jgi:hypothetical protein
MSAEATSINFPKQKLSKRKKTKKWAQECIDASISATSLYDNTRRSPKYRKLRNYGLYNGKFDKQDLEYVCNPLGFSGEGYDFPANMQYYPIATPIFDLLFGEESKRPFSYVVKAVNGDSISAKEEKQKEAIKQALQQRLANLISPQEGEQTDFVASIQKYFKYEYQDMRESVAAKILSYLHHDLKLDQLFQLGWEDVLLAGEEIYKIEKVANEPIVKRCNPAEIDALLPHNSYHLDEAEVIVEETYMSISEIVDNYYEELTPSEIDSLEDDRGDRVSISGNQQLMVPDRRYIGVQGEGSPISSYGNLYDPDGNLRVCHVTWKSKRRVGELSFTDDMGNTQSKVVGESYKAGKDEKISWFWINEYWEGTKIGDDIYVQIHPKDVQFRRMDNISKCSSGYVGTVYNANNAQSVSLMDRLVPWIYMFIAQFYRTELLISANQGKIALIDLALVPDGWEVEKWMYYATSMKFGFVDSFNEGKKGQSTGKLAGNISTQNKVLDLETGAAIQGHIQLLEYIELKIQELSGVTDQRMGAITSSEKVGNTQRAVTQSSHITEKWFRIHNWTKQRVLTNLVEIAKDCWDGQSKKFQYVGDDLSSVFFSVDGNEFNNSEYGVFISDSSEDLEALDALKQYAHAALQNDRVLLSEIAEIYSSKSLADVKSKLQQSEEKMRQREDAQAEQAQSTEMKIAQMEQQKIDKELEKDYYKIEKDNETKITVAEINSFKMQEDQDSNDNGVPDQLEIAKLKAASEHNARKLDIEEKKLDQKGKELKQRKELEEKKIKAQKANKSNK